MLVVRSPAYYVPTRSGFGPEDIVSLNPNNFGQSSVVAPLQPLHLHRISKQTTYIQDTVMVVEMIMNAVMVLLTASLVVTGLLWGWFQWSHRRLLREARKLPSLLPTLPLLGHAHHTVFGMEKVTERVLSVSKEAVARGAYTVCFWLGPLPLIMVHSAEDIRKVLLSSVTAEKADEYSNIRRLLGQGLLAAPADVWSISRSHLSPMFHPRSVEQLVPLFNRNSRQLVKSLEEQCKEQTGAINVLDYTMDTSLQTVCNFLFGADSNIDKQSDGYRGLRLIVESFPGLVMKLVVRVWMRIEIVFKLVHKKELDAFHQLWEAFADPVLKKIRGQHYKRSTGLLQNGISENNEEAEIYLDNTGQGDFINTYSALQKSHPMFTDQDLKNEMLTIIGTGTDTVGLSVASCFLLLAYHQDIQDQLFAEISCVVGCSSDDVSTQDLLRMSYLDQVCKETLRWSMIVPYIARKTSHDIQLSSCVVPAGCTVAVGLAGLHMDPRIYPNPEVFDPERFSSANKANNKKYTFIPFSIGPRNCIGQRYAEVLIKVMIVHVLRKFHLTTKMDIHNLKRKLAITLVCTEGYNVKLTCR